MAFWLVDNNRVNTSNTTDVNTTARFCDLCRDKIKQNVRPALALADGLDFPETHCCLDDLTRLEERLVAARHVFQSIWTLHGNSGQYRSKGGIVNVPVNVDTTVSALPRQLDDSFIIHLSLARRMRYLKDYIKGNISTAKVWIAASFLQTQPLYIEHEIELDDTWMESATVETNYVGTDIGMKYRYHPLVNIVLLVIFFSFLFRFRLFCSLKTCLKMRIPQIIQMKIKTIVITKRNLRKKKLKRLIRKMIILRPKVVWATSYIQLYIINMFT